LKHKRLYKECIKFFVVAILLVLVIAPFMVPDAQADSNTRPYSILFDEAHDQYFTYSNQLFKSAIDYLNQTADFQVFLNTELFANATELGAYDLIIIGNPGLNTNFTPTEIEVIKNYTISGGHLILLSNYYAVVNPLYDEDDLGNAAALNNITHALNLSVSFTDSDLHHFPPTTDLGREIVELDDSVFKSFHPVKHKIGTVLTYTSGLNTTDEQHVIATGYADSYLEDADGNRTYDTPWLYGTEIGKSRIILCGSTAMFSDVNVTNDLDKDYSETYWIDAADNLKLWANLIQWTLIKEIPFISMVFIILICVFFAIGTGLYVYNTYFVSPELSQQELEKQQLLDERASVLKEARIRTSEGLYLAAAKLYKQAAKISNKLKDFKGKNQFTKNFQQLLEKERKRLIESAETNAEEGNYLAAAQFYKQAAVVSNKLGDRKREHLYNQKNKEFFSKSKK
jgi:hypothetical protein